MQQSKTNNARHMRFYAGQAWEELQTNADELGQRSSRKRVTDVERIDFIERSALLEGGIRMAQRLVPEMWRRHRQALERNFSHLLNELQRLEAVPAVSAEDRATAQQEALAIVSLMDAGEESVAEERIHLLEQRVEQMAIDGIDRDIESRLGVIRRLLEAVA